MKNGIFESITGLFELKEKNIGLYSPLVLAYIGDAVFEVYIRTYLVSEGHASVHKLHKRTTGFVKAKAQAAAVHKIADQLSQEESDIVRRGRNAKSGTIPKNADVTEYKYATGFEALIGFLYLKQDFSRLMQILSFTLQDDKNQDPT